MDISLFITLVPLAPSLQCPERTAELSQAITLLWRIFSASLHQQPRQTSKEIDRPVGSSLL